jgi:MFS family permease
MTRVVPVLLVRFGPRWLAATGSVLMAVGLLWLTRITPSTEYLTGVFGPMALLGVGGGLGFVPLTPVIMASVPPAQAGSAGGVLQTMQQLGSTVGLAVLVTVFGAAIRGTAHDPADVVHGMTVAFMVAAAIAGVTFLVALTFRRPSQPGTQPAAGAPADSRGTAPALRGTGQ